MLVNCDTAGDIRYEVSLGMGKTAMGLRILKI